MRDPLKVLVVEDDAVTRQILLRILKDRGYQVSAFATAEEAMRTCGERIYPSQFLDLVLLGAYGFTFCRVGLLLKYFLEPRLDSFPRIFEIYEPRRG
jgi:CheY-like chemotaxis protein